MLLYTLMDEATRKISIDEKVFTSPEYFKAGMSFIISDGSFQCGYNLAH